jgi:hypothetical protein
MLNMPGSPTDGVSAVASDRPANPVMLDCAERAHGIFHFIYFEDFGVAALEHRMPARRRERSSGHQ